jgi:NDP-4-keto-2,6-dideoxyhexose 3-C-methyltransferase
MKEFKNSILSSEKLETLFTLGELYVSDFLKINERPKYSKCELALAFDPITKLVQLTKQPDKEAMWGSQYWYLSSSNPQMKLALKDVAEKTINCIPRKNEKEIYIDIAGNDGTLLSYVNKNEFIRINIDPSDYKENREFVDFTIKDYFSAQTYKNIFSKARYISCCAVLYDIENPNKFVRDIYEILTDDGILTVQLSYTPLMILQNEIGNICHEHLAYYNLTSLKYLFENNGFVIKDLELNNVNGGSIRLYIQKQETSNNFKSPSDKDIADIRIKSLLEWEENHGFNNKNLYLDFFQRMKELKEKILFFINTEKSNGKSIWGYGASTKGNTLLQFLGLNNTLIDGIAEVQERKYGLRTVGTNIPIYSEEEMRNKNPNYLLIGPWFFLDTFKQKEENYLKNGGAFILTSPEFSIFTLNK